MQRLLIPVTLLLLLVWSACGPKATDKDQHAASAPGQKPNILLIVADDLGFSDIGPFGGNIETPVLDALSKEGTVFSNFHVLPTCSPTRSALLSGQDNHVAGMGIMHELSYPAVADLPGYQGHLTRDLITLPEILRQNGYHTYMSGKWHLGDEAGDLPYDRGFEEEFALLGGGGSHFADRKALSPLQRMDYTRNGKMLDKLPEDFYSTTSYTDSIIAFIEKGKHDGNPFFAYLSYTAVHDPLQAPAEYIAKYKGRFDSGWDSLRTMRLANLKALGMMPEEVVDYFPSPTIPKWSSLPAAKREEFSRDMEVYAAMLDYLDYSIGRVLDYLRKTGQYDNTMIVFMSDNGANGAMATSYPGNGDGKYLSQFDNSMSNRGLRNSYVEMGPGWAQASSSPLRLFKTFTTEGGVKAPLIIKMPAGHSPKSNVHSKQFIHVTDMLPTLLEVTGLRFPETFKDKPSRKPIGTSFAGMLKGDTLNPGGSKEVGYELFEMRAYIRGNWKILRLPIPMGTGEWQLYDLSKDPAEAHDLSSQHPEIKEELVTAWKKYAAENNVYDHKGHYDTIYRNAYAVPDGKH